MVTKFNNLSLCRCFRALSLGFVFLLFGGPLAHADDYVYVSNTSAGTVTRIDPSGNTSIFASGLNGPEGLAFDNAGNLYVANSGNGTISEINSVGNVSTFASGFYSPGLASKKRTVKAGH
jgi:DNA-binding beta-propeller fold protein YncE